MSSSRTQLWRRLGLTVLSGILSPSLRYCGRPCRRSRGAHGDMSLSLSQSFPASLPRSLPRIVRPRLAPMHPMPRLRSPRIQPTDHGLVEEKRGRRRRAESHLPRHGRSHPHSCSRRRVLRTPPSCSSLRRVFAMIDGSESGCADSWGPALPARDGVVPGWAGMGSRLHVQPRRRLPRRPRVHLGCTPIPITIDNADDIIRKFRRSSSAPNTQTNGSG